MLLAEGLTQKQAAAHLGVHTRNVTNALGQMRERSNEALIALATRYSGPPWKSSAPNRNEAGRRSSAIPGPPTHNQTRDVTLRIRTDAWRCNRWICRLERLGKVTRLRYQREGIVQPRSGYNGTRDAGVYCDSPRKSIRDVEVSVATQAKVQGGLRTLSMRWMVPLGKFLPQGQAPGRHNRERSIETRLRRR
jgi:transposase